MSDEIPLDGFYRNYVRSFYANATSFTPTAFPFHPYHVQARNPILRRVPIRGPFDAMPVDFYQNRDINDTSDPFRALLEK